MLKVEILLVEIGERINTYFGIHLIKSILLGGKKLTRKYSSHPSYWLHE